MREGLTLLDGHTDDLPIGTIWVEDLEIGMSRFVNKTIRADEIDMFARMSCDHNPLHLCDDYAGQTPFGGRIAHGMLTAGLISAGIGEQLPGHGTIYLGQNLSFHAPVRPGDRVEASVSVAAIEHDRRRVTLDCRATVGDTVVLTGDALVLAPSRHTG